MPGAEERARELVRKDISHTWYGLTRAERIRLAGLYGFCALLMVIGATAFSLGISEFWATEWLTDGTVVASGAATVVFAVALLRTLDAERAKLVLSRWDERDSLRSRGEGDQ
jgi:hypothetical protein